MKIHLNSILKNKNLIKYILIGILNTIFAYISGVVFFNLFYKEIGAFLLTLLATIVNIFFTFINYKNSFVSIIYCSPSQNLSPHVPTILLKGGRMISAALDNQKD